MQDDLKQSMRDDLHKVFGRHSEVEATYKVYANATYYPEYIRVYIPDIPYDKLLPFLEGDSKKLTKTNAKKDKTSIEDDLERSLRRTKKIIADYVICNPFNLFATFTFSPEKTKDRADPDAVKTQMANWLKNQQARYGKFDYLIVPEFHADKKSLHFHALFLNYAGKMISSGKKYRGRQAYNLKSYTLGYNSAVVIDDRNKLSSYVRKYITKDMPQFHGKHRFWATNGLSRPRIEDNPDDWYLREKPMWSHVTPYGRTLFFPIRPSVVTQVDSLTEDSTQPSLPGLDG